MKLSCADWKTVGDCVSCSAGAQGHNWPPARCASAADAVGVFRKVEVVINVVLAYLCLLTSHKEFSYGYATFHFLCKIVAFILILIIIIIIIFILFNL